MQPGQFDKEPAEVPQNGQVVTVFFNPTTGEHRYVADKERHPAGR
jgi:hypothetical protein